MYIDDLVLHCLPQCNLYLQQTTGGGRRAEGRRERGSERGSCYYHGSARGAPADHWYRGGGGPRDHPGQFPWGEAASTLAGLFLS